MSNTSRLTSGSASECQRKSLKNNQCFQIFSSFRTRTTTIHPSEQSFHRNKHKKEFQKNLEKKNNRIDNNIYTMTTQTATTEEKTEQRPSCPYAQALKDNQNSSSMSSIPGLVELQECPAFSKECPFKGATSAEDVTAKLKEIPTSHLDNNGTFYKTLEYFHRANNQTSPNSRNKSLLSIGSCPVKHALPENWSFDHAMEEYSLASVMGKLAQEWEDKEEKKEETTSHDADTDKKSFATPVEMETGSRSGRRLSDALKCGTAVAHEAAENVHFVKNFIRGIIDRELYGLLVAQLFHVYQRLEKALDLHAPLYFPTCHFPKELHRTEALREDLEFWHTKTPPASPAAQDYIDRIDYLSKHKPLLLLAHAYTRYLGDLSGGKVLARVARRALQLKGDGLAFYEFPHVESFKLFKDQYRSSLNQLPLTQSQIEEVVHEANIAFLLNMRLFEELDVVGGVPGANIRSLDDVYSAPSKAILNTDNADAPCPFAAGSKKKVKSGTCPWPFILLHDPKAGMQAWQSWLVLGLILVYVYKTVFLVE